MRNIKGTYFTETPVVVKQSRVQRFHEKFNLIKT